MSEAIERHQLAGFDDRERGFNRPVECERTPTGYRAILRYETLRIAAEHPVSTTEALRELVALLHRRGYRELRSQLSFQNATYLGTQEPWVSYEDPAGAEQPTHGLWQKLKQWIQGVAPIR